MPYLLVGERAENFATEHGCEMWDPNNLIIEEQRQMWEQKEVSADRPEMVGCVALDCSGNLAAATSTGGIPLKNPDCLTQSIMFLMENNGSK